MSQSFFYPSPSLTLSAIGANGAAIPTTSLLVAGSDGTNLQPLKTDSSGHLIIDGTTTGGATAANQVLEIAQLTAINGKLPASLGSKLSAASLSIVLASDGTLPLPSGAATAANQATEIASLASIDTKLTSPLTVTGPLTDAQLRATPVPVSGTVTVSGGATAANQATEIASLASIDTKTPALGQALAASSVPVVLTAAQLSTLTPLSSVTVSGTVAATQSGTWNITNVSGTISLPTGAATAVKQPALGTAGTASADVITVQGIASMTALKVDGSAVTQPVSLATGPAGGASGNSPGSSTVSTVATITAPANAMGFILMNLDTSTASIRYRIGATATSSSGQQLQPGRDTGFIPCRANISICAESSTQNYDIQWVIQ